MPLSFFSKPSFASKRGLSMATVVLAAAFTLPVSANAQSQSGDNGPNIFTGTTTGSMNVDGKKGYDRVDYDGVIEGFSFERSAKRNIRVRKSGGGIDILRNIEAVSFGGTGRIFDFDDIFAPVDQAQFIIVYQGTEAAETFPSRTRSTAFYAGGGGLDTVNYLGNRDEYVFELQGDGNVEVTKLHGDIDRLQAIERVSFGNENSSYDIEDLINPGEPVDPVEPVDTEQLYHFGQPIDLVGANIAWSDNNRFSSDFGRSDGFGNPNTNLIDFQEKFDQIARNGGNSARIWLHTTAQVTPNVDQFGRTLGLSRELTDEQVVGQLTEVLDSAWDRGIVVTFSLFSFDMLCDSHANAFDYPGSMERHLRLLNGRRQLYFDRALTPMVTGMKDHPALFAYEIFNEPEGMYKSVQFCNSATPANHFLASRFVNEAAATIHRLDPNVKVTTSTHTDLFNDFSNTTLTSREGADPEGTLDFYELHWYQGWGRDPYTTPASSYEADRPVIIGEFDVSQSDEVSNNASPDSINAILSNGYAGAWPWSFATVNDAQPIRDAIDTARQTPINKTAIEACIRDKSPECYKE